ncbi:hypothetical protein [Acidisphaera sp. S103]|uniref:hypothetical protein n=1 Tax=Acidisphaera sp. S103 TaxID=1747223 RepID=UPI00131DC34E|nr:hypothetical protein [Acidisphaera sp. S103]
MAEEPIETRLPAIRSAVPVVARPPEIQALARTVRDAEDPRIVRVVAIVDAMINRGPIDQLIAPIRPRLVRLRPPRPLRFARLLFHPLDRLFVPAARWRPEQKTLMWTARR